MRHTCLDVLEVPTLMYSPKIMSWRMNGRMLEQSECMRTFRVAGHVQDSLSLQLRDRTVNSVSRRS